MYPEAPKTEFQSIIILSGSTFIALSVGETSTGGTKSALSVVNSQTSDHGEYPFAFAPRTRQ